ncbi:helix-turn-helix protein [compost metagenome]
MPTEHPGFKLARQLEATNTTQTELAARLGTSQALLSRVLRGLAPITPWLAVRLHRAIGIPALSLLRAQSEYDVEVELTALQSLDTQSPAS